MAVRSIKLGRKSPLLGRAGVLAALAARKEAPARGSLAILPPLRTAPPGATYRFTVTGEPVTWKRAKRGEGHSYTDPKDEAHREKIRAAARNAGVRLPIAGPVSLTLRFYRGNTDDPTALCTGDLDNLEKAVKDALKGIAYLDDRQVCDVHKRKRLDRCAPRTEVFIAAGFGVHEPEYSLEDDLAYGTETTAGKDLTKGPP